MATITFELVSPERLLVSAETDLVELPAAEGYMGVLPGHAPMIVTLQGGVIRMHDGGKVSRRLYVAGGFAEVTASRVTVLADEATAVEDLSRDIAATRIAEAEAAYQAAALAPPAQREAAFAKLQAARAMQAAIG